MASTGRPTAMFSPQEPPATALAPMPVTLRDYLRAIFRESLDAEICEVVEYLCARLNDVQTATHDASTARVGAARNEPSPPANGAATVSPAHPLDIGERTESISTEPSAATLHYRVRGSLLDSRESRRRELERTRARRLSLPEEGKKSQLDSDVEDDGPAATWSGCPSFNSPGFRPIVDFDGITPLSDADDIETASEDLMDSDGSGWESAAEAGSGSDILDWAE